MPNDRETGWLIELPRQDGPEWFELLPGSEHGWTKDSLKALRFARKQDAEAHINDIGWTEAVATEHEWLGPCAAQTSATPSGEAAAPGAEPVWHALLDTITDAQEYAEAQGSAKMLEKVEVIGSAYNSLRRLLALHPAPVSSWEQGREDFIRHVVKARNILDRSFGRPADEFVLDCVVLLNTGLQAIGLNDHGKPLGTPPVPTLEPDASVPAAPPPEVTK